jgi:hypothetical protein
LIHSSKRTNEGGYILTDRLDFSYHGPKDARVHILRHTPERVRIDTTLSVTPEYVFDMLGAVFYLRTLDCGHLKIGDLFPATVVSGRELININCRYGGEDTLERDGKRRRTFLFYIDINDSAFTQQRAAAEVWVSSDASRLPLKVRMKLKIGYAEVYCKQSSGLKTEKTD